MTTYTQNEAEIEVRDALSTRSRARTDRETVSDAVDIYLGRLEQDQGHTINRNEIPDEAVSTILETIVNNAQLTP